MSPRTAQQFHDMRAESQTKILESALELFARFGYEQTSIRMIAQSAGISQGLMYRYFASKEQLLQALLLRGIEDVQAAFQQAEDAATPTAKLERIIRQSFALLQQPQAQRFWKLSYSVRMQPAVLAGPDEHVQRWVESIRQAFEEHFRASGATHPMVEAAILVALIDGIAQHYALDPEHYPLDAVVDAVVAKYCAAPEADDV